MLCIRNNILQYIILTLRVVYLIIQVQYMRKREKVKLPETKKKKRWVNWRGYEIGKVAVVRMEKRGT